MQQLLPTTATPAVEFPAIFSPLVPVLGQFQPSRYKVLLGGRGAAKSWTVARSLLLLASQWKLRILCTREFQGSIAESVHELLKQQIFALGLSDQYIIENKSIRNTITGSEFFFEGLRHNINKIRSMEGVDIAWVEEAALVSKKSWRILKPTIRKSNYPEGHCLQGAEIWVSFNPELETDFTYEHFVLKPRKNSIVIHANWRDNPFFTDVNRAEMEEDREENYNEYLHIWEGQPKSFTEGAVYGQELTDALGEERLTRVPYRPGLPVTTYWDLGKRGMTSIIFTQTHGPMEHVIKSYQNCKKNLDHYFKYLQRQNFFYGYCILPHDARHDRLGMKATIERQFQDAGFKTKVVEKDLIATGIEHTRNLFPRLAFDVNNCEDLLTALRHYRYEIIESEVDGKKTFSKEPLKDGINDHFADALRMKGMAHILWPNHTTKFNPMGEAQKLLPQTSGKVELLKLRKVNIAANGGGGWMR